MRAETAAAAAAVATSTDVEEPRLRTGRFSGRWNSGESPPCDGTRAGQGGWARALVAGWGAWEGEGGGRLVLTLLGLKP